MKSPEFLGQKKDPYQEGGSSPSHFRRVWLSRGRLAKLEYPRWQIINLFSVRTKEN